MNILYCRKSSEAADKQVASIESQKDNLLELAKRDNLVVSKIFTESMSAKQPGRPEFEKMLRLIKQRPGSVILVWKLDRLARNPVDEGQIKWLLQKNTIAKIITPERIYYPEDNALIASVEFGMANQFIRDLSRNVKRGNETKLKNGGFTGLAPLGYLNDRLTKSVVVDPVQSLYVEKIFRLFATGGYSLKDTANKMYDEGLRTKQGKKIHASLFYRMITNPFYTGVMTRGGKNYQGSYVPLVSSELYQACQRMLTGNRSKKQKHLFPLRGFMQCADCACMITASMRRGHQYYHCTDGKSVHKGKQEPREHFRSEVLNKAVAAKFKELQFDERQIEIMYKASLEKNKSDDNFIDTAKNQIINSQKLLQEKRQRTEDVFIDGSLTKERYEARILDLNNQETDLSNQLKQLEQNSKIDRLDIIGQTKKAFLTAVYAEKDFLSGDDFKKRELVEILLSDITIKDQKVQQIQFKPAFQRMYLSPKKLDFVLWGARRGLDAKFLKLWQSIELLGCEGLM